jgi:hypothetical protein
VNSELHNSYNTHLGATKQQVNLLQAGYEPPHGFFQYFVDLFLHFIEFTSPFLSLSFAQSPQVFIDVGGLGVGGDGFGDGDGAGGPDGVGGLGPGDGECFGLQHCFLVQSLLQGLLLTPFF